MPSRAIVYRVMIGSPSDPGSEREAATQVINEWNVQHAEAEGVVLLPVKWETHATPTTGVRPQAAINEQLADRCDIFIGMFWTRLGSKNRCRGFGDRRGNRPVCRGGKADAAVLLQSQSQSGQGRHKPSGQAADL